MRTIQRVALLLGALGTVFFVVGLLFVRDADTRARARAPSFVTPTSLGARPIGTTVVLVGRIAETNATPFRDFVAFERSAYAGYRGEQGQAPRPQWRRVARVAPRLVITETSGATIDMVGDDYGFAGELAQFEDETLARASGSRPASTRAEGFRRGDHVVVLGTVESARAVRAHTLFRGNRADYVRSLAMAVTTSRVLGYVFTPLGLVLAMIAFALLRHRARTTAVAALAIALVFSASCYRSRLIHFGTPVEVVTGTVSGNAVWVTGPHPAVGAYVTAERCHDGERREARVGDDGFAWLEFDEIDCFTVTAVRADRTHAISVVRAPAPLATRIVFTDFASDGFETDRTSISGTITGRLAPDHRVTLELSDGRVTERFETTTDTFAGSFGGVPKTDFLVAIEWDGAWPVNAAIVSSSRRVGGDVVFDVRLPSPPVPIHALDLELSLPRDGVRSLDTMYASVGAYIRRFDGRPWGVWTSGGVTIEPLVLGAHAPLRRIHARWPELAWPASFSGANLSVAIHEDEDVLSAFGVSNGPVTEAPFLAIAPIEAGEITGATLGSVSVRVGGDRHHTTIELHPLRPAWFTETPAWQIMSSGTGVFVLDSLPSLPEGVTLDDLGFSRGEDVSISAVVSSAPPIERLVGFEMWPHDGWEIVAAEHVAPRD